MNFSVKELSLDGADFSKYSIEGNTSSLPNLSKINIFVGPNNSGKSRFLRQIASIEKVTFRPTVSLETIESVRQQLVSNLEAIAKRYRIQDAGHLVSESTTIKPLVLVRENDPVRAPLLDFVAKIRRQDLNGFGVSGSFGAMSADFSGILNEMQAAGRVAEDGLKPVMETIPATFSFKRLYFPTLRGLRSLDSKNPYEQRTKKDYFSKADHVEIFTGLELYEEIKKLLLGNLEERETVAEFQRFLSNAFFERQPVALIPRHNQDVLDVKIGEEAQRPIYELGDGIQSIIILTFPLFKYRDTHLLVFIEEPELFMHPGLQRLFLNVLREFPRAQYFLATHSNHLLDLTLDIEQVAVFTFRKSLIGEGKKEKDAHVTIENVSNDDERSLQLLGIQNSSVFLSNSTVWVEGITDRRYISHYLDLYQQRLHDEAAGNSLPLPRRYRQDLHYSFVEYAGANITHFSFLENETDPIVVDRLCAKLFLITDKDDEAKGGKGERHKALSEKLGDRYVCLDSREIENLLTPEIISAVIKSYEGETELNAFVQADYQDQPLGQFIEEKVLKGAKKRKGSYRAKKSGTISDKITFCQKALENIKRFDDLSPEAQSLTEKVYKFIESKNS